MLMIALVLLLFLGIYIFDYRLVIKAKKKNEIWLYSITYIVGLCLMLLRAMDIDLPKINTGLQKLIDSIFH